MKQKRIYTPLIHKTYSEETSQRSMQQLKGSGGLVFLFNFVLQANIMTDNYSSRKRNIKPQTVYCLVCLEHFGTQLQLIFIQMASYQELKPEVEKTCESSNRGKGLPAMYLLGDAYQYYFVVICPVYQEIRVSEIKKYYRKNQSMLKSTQLPKFENVSEFRFCYQTFRIRQQLQNSLI